MVFKACPGYVLIQVCDTPILVGTRKVWEASPVIRPLPKAGAIAWSMIEAGAPWERIVKTCSALGHAAPEAAEQMLCVICKNLVKDGLLIEIPDEGDEHDEV